MGDNKNFMSRHIIRVIIMIIDIIMISLNSATGTKIVKVEIENILLIQMFLSNESSDSRGIYGNIVLAISHC